MTSREAIGCSAPSPTLNMNSSTAGMNQQLNDEIETVFLMADVALQPIASRLVKEIALYGGDIGKFVPPVVVADVTAKLAG